MPYLETDLPLQRINGLGTRTNRPTHPAHRVEPKCWQRDRASHPGLRPIETTPWTR